MPHSYQRGQDYRVHLSPLVDWRLSPAIPTTCHNSKKTFDVVSLPNDLLRSAWARDQVVEYEDTAFYLEADTFDPCGGHSTTKGIYHYHGTAGCVQEQAEGRVGEHSPLLGWSLVSAVFCLKYGVVT